MRRKLTWLFAALILISIVVISLVYFQPQPVKSIELVSAPIPKTLYGINIDTLEVESNSVKPGENLSVILSTFLTPRQIDDLARNTRAVFDVRKVKPGNKYSFLVTTDSVAEALYFIYEINAIDYVVYDLRDSIRAYTGKKEVQRIMRFASGTITTSMWNTFTEHKLDVNLALALSEVYAWTVDFYGLQKGDRFKVIYDELSVDG